MSKNFFSIKVIVIVIIHFVFSYQEVYPQNVSVPDTISFTSGNLILRGLLWVPKGKGNFPALIFSHGNYASKARYGTVDSLLGPVKAASMLAPVFTKRGYIFFVPFRRGVGLSKDEGVSSADMMNNSLQNKGQDERNKIQIQQLETDQLQDMIAALAFLKKRKGVDINHIAVIGHSFGGSLALILAEQDSNLKAVVDFSGGAYSWNISPLLQARLTDAVTKINAPVFFIHAKNDYSTAPADSLGALMDKLGKPHQVKIYSPFGKSIDEAHNFIFLGIDLWKEDVLKFLDKYLQH